MTEPAKVDPLDAIAAQADALGAAAANDETIEGQGAPVAPALTNTQCLMMAFSIIRETVCGFAKVQSPKVTMSDEVMAPVAEAIGAVLDKYNVSLSGIGGDFMTEIKAAIVVVPVVLSIRAGLAAEVKASKAQANKDTGPPMANVVNTDGTPVGE